MDSGRDGAITANQDSQVWTLYAEQSLAFALAVIKLYCNCEKLGL